ncbi:MAG TPA: exo-alpha-sialidase [Candidatus Binatia bacterium]|nr:exo-alpha-sialidase [Candidatus Binatia bacterium]
MARALLMIGTRKGLLIARSDDSRRTWTLDELRFPNQEVYAVGIDSRCDPPRLFASGTFGWWGPFFTHSDDLGATWAESRQAAIAFPAEAETALARVWQIQPGPPNQPGVVYAGVEPHALFRSDDGGESFSLVRGLWDHPHRSEWRPGNGGACLHTVIPHPTDPAQCLVAMSTGGVYRTEDGGATWNPRNRGIEVSFAPEDARFPEYGQCVHKVAMHPDRPSRLFAQNHGGVYRSEDGGDEWTAIETGLPSNFGFPMVVHPQQPDTVFAFPLGEGRLPSDTRCRVYRSQDAGATWHPVNEGLPEEPYLGGVLRDAMCTDWADPAGLFFGTRIGEVFWSRDGGESWGQVAQRLPDVLSVRAAEFQ